MRIYVMQHARAVSKDQDPERPLSATGVADARAMADFLAGCGVRVGEIYHSGKARARQTAEAMAATLLPAGEARLSDGLRPNDPVDGFAARVDGWRGDTLVVGHQPFVSRLVTHLLTGDREEPLVGFQPGSIACLERVDAAGWALQWMIRPELLASTRDA